MQVIALYLGSRYVKILLITVVTVMAPIAFVCLSKLSLRRN